MFFVFFLFVLNLPKIVKMGKNGAQKVGVEIETDQVESVQVELNLKKRSNVVELGVRERLDVANVSQEQVLEIRR